MNFRNYRFKKNSSTQPATVFVAPDNAAFSVSDFSGTVTQDASKLRLTRLLSDGNNWQKVTPGARIRFSITNTGYAEVKLEFEFTGLISNAYYNDVASVLVNGSQAIDFVGPNPFVAGQPLPIGSVFVVLRLPAGTHLVEILMPYLASIDFKGLYRAVGSSLSAASARTSQKAVFIGDSIVHGFFSSKTRNHWTHLLCEQKSWQQVNLAYGQRSFEIGDFTVAASIGAGRTITNFGINNCFSGSSPASIQSAVEQCIAAFRAVTTTQKLYYINLFDCTHPGLITTPSAARSAIAAAFAAVGGINDILIPGGTANGLPAASLSPDLIHPTDAMSSTIASVLGGLTA